MTLTEHWLQLYEQHRELGALRGSIFWRLAVVAGLPEGVDATDPRVVEAIKVIQQATAGCGCPE